MIQTPPPPSNPSTRGRGKRRLIGKRCVDLLRSSSLGSDATLHCQDISSLVQQQDSVVQLKQQGSAESAWVSGKQPESAGIPREVLWCLSLYEATTNEDQRRPVKFCKTNQCKSIVHCLWGSSYSLCKHQESSQVSASAKHPLTRQLSEEHRHDTTESPKKPDISTSALWIWHTWSLPQGMSSPCRWVNQRRYQSPPLLSGVWGSTWE